LDPELLERYIDHVDAVIAVHSYGTPCKIKQIEKICREYNVMLIEDVCVAQGATLDGCNVGKYGDASIVSFGSGKIIDVGHGGAILSNNSNIAIELEHLISQLPLGSMSGKIKIDDFCKKHTQLYNQYYGYNINSFAENFKKEALDLQSAYLHQFDNNYSHAILDKLNLLPETVEKRINKNFVIKEYFSSFDKEYISFTNPPQGFVPWRTSILIQNERNQLLKRLVKKNFKASSWYPSSDLFFENRELSNIKTPVSDWLGDRILNIWVNDEVEHQYISSITSEIKSFLNGE
jgi:dTDP-4-amino-4,6-dideoxygalactose transaminase